MEKNVVEVKFFKVESFQNAKKILLDLVDLFYLPPPPTPPPPAPLIKIVEINVQHYIEMRKLIVDNIFENYPPSDIN
jgi:hypothetical protein